MTVAPGLYHAEAGEILAHLREATAPSVMVIGHNPGIGSSRTGRGCARTAPAVHRLPDCATLVARFAGDDWSGVDWWGGRVVDFVVPRDL